MVVETLKLVDGRYLLQEQVAGGGSVELYFALDRHLQRPVALEILSANAAKDQAICDRFHLHQRSASAIHHPNVLETYDAGEWDGRPYLVMERDAGQPPPRAAVVSEAVPDLAAALRMTRQAAEAISFCRQAGLDDWPFSYKAVRIGTSGSAQIALLEDAHLGGTDGPFISRRAATDPPALAALFRLLISGAPERERIQVHLSTLPPSVAEVLRRMEPGAQDSFASAGEVADALREIEAASNDYTQMNLPTQSGEQTIGVVPSFPDLQRTSSLAEAPTLAVAWQSAIPSVPYIPASASSAHSLSVTATAPAVATSEAASQGRSGPYIPSTIRGSGRRRRVVLLLGLVLLVLLLVGGAVSFLARTTDTGSGIVSNNLAALPTATTAAVLPTTTTTAAVPTATTAATPPPVPVAVPELVGKSLDEATTIAEGLGIGLSVIDPVYSNDIPPDTVATQDPAPGVDLPAGGIVMVALSLGPQPVEEDEDDDDEEGSAPPPDEKQSADKKKKDNGKKR